MENREIKFRVWNPSLNIMTIVSRCEYMGFNGIVYDLVGCTTLITFGCNTQD